MGDTDGLYHPSVSGYNLIEFSVFFCFVAYPIVKDVDMILSERHRLSANSTLDEKTLTN